MPVAGRVADEIRLIDDIADREEVEDLDHAPAQLNLPAEQVDSLRPVEVQLGHLGRGLQGADRVPELGGHRRLPGRGLRNLRRLPVWNDRHPDPVHCSRPSAALITPPCTGLPGRSPRSGSGWSTIW